jgi:hypothetical protein
VGYRDIFRLDLGLISDSNASEHRTRRAGYDAKASTFSNVPHDSKLAMQLPVQWPDHKQTGRAEPVDQVVGADAGEKAEIVHHHNVHRSQSRCQKLPHIG